MNCKFFLDKSGKVSKNVTVFLLRGKVGQETFLSNESAKSFLYNEGYQAVREMKYAKNCHYSGL